MIHAQGPRECWTCHLGQSNLDIPREGVGTVTGCGKSGKKETDVSS